jgi:hypothetical protein
MGGYALNAKRVTDFFYDRMKVRLPYSVVDTDVVVGDNTAVSKLWVRRYYDAVMGHLAGCHIDWSGYYENAVSPGSMLAADSEWVKMIYDRVRVNSSLPYDSAVFPFNGVQSFELRITGSDNDGGNWVKAVPTTGAAVGSFRVNQSGWYLVYAQGASSGSGGGGMRSSSSDYGHEFDAWKAGGGYGGYLNGGSGGYYWWSESGWGDWADGSASAGGGGGGMPALSSLYYTPPGKNEVLLVQDSRIDWVKHLLYDGAVGNGAGVYRAGGGGGAGLYLNKPVSKYSGLNLVYEKVVLESDLSDTGGFPLASVFPLVKQVNGARGSWPARVLGGAGDSYGQKNSPACVAVFSMVFLEAGGYVRAVLAMPGMGGGGGHIKARGNHRYGEGGGYGFPGAYQLFCVKEYKFYP